MAENEDSVGKTYSNDPSVNHMNSNQDNLPESQQKDFVEIAKK